jgi:hypothetical protein
VKDQITVEELSQAREWLADLAGAHGHSLPDLANDIVRIWKDVGFRPNPQLDPADRPRPTHTQVGRFKQRFMVLIASRFCKRVRGRLERAKKNGQVELHVDLNDVDIMLSLAEAGVSVYERAAERGPQEGG